jgi:hypothetical protein
MKSINGQVSNETSIIQNYMPDKEGTITLPPFVMKINGQSVRSPGAKIVVGPPADNRASDPFAYDPFEDFFGKPGEGTDGKTDAFFSIQSNKKEIWAGEGITITISFFVADDNQAELNFYDVGNQLANIVKRIKPENCWEENFGIEEIIPRKVRLGKKGYTEYRIYQSTLFPIVAKDLQVPALTLNMMQYKGGAGFGRAGREEIKPFYSKPLQIKVKPLPPHPMRGNVSVGTFTLVDKPGRKQVALNQGLGLDVSISGEGNISYVPEPQVVKSALLDVYPPNTQQTIQRANGKVSGEKVFSYLLVPRERGDFNLRNTFFWVFFNTKTGQYDTLRPQSTINVLEGKSAGTAGTSAKAQDSFYSWIEKADPSLQNLTQRVRDPWSWVNFAMAGMALITLVLMFVRR